MGEYFCCVLCATHRDSAMKNNSTLDEIKEAYIPIAKISADTILTETNHPVSYYSFK